VALDLAEDVLGAARLHALESGLSVDYRAVPVERLAEAEPARYDAVACMELLEHVPDPAALVHDCARLLKPEGRLYVSTLNRTPESFLTAIVGAEYLAGLLPKGTHQFAQFIRPSELCGWIRAAGLRPLDVAGLQYRPVTRRAWVGGAPSVNYLVSAVKPA
jgi:2-polyprenyl-6-hydroxyphenyl methylase/3-demethylubiquinone-9 3-methyltransferase